MGIEVFEDMIGKTIETITGKVGDDEMIFRVGGGGSFRFYHAQDCRESVQIEDICGDLADLLGSPIVEAEKVSSEGTPAPECSESYTWTFYRYATARGAVTVRWLGQSNGYYSEGVCFEARP